MEQKKTNQERGRKYGGSSSFVDTRQPSKAPRQDEDGKELVGSSRVNRHQVDAHASEQGISNRPVNDEHAFPDSDKSGAEPDMPESVDTTPKQQGGNKGGV